MKNFEIALNVVKRDPISYFYRALNAKNLKPEHKEKLERTIILIEKMNKFEELLDFWKSSIYQEFFIEEKAVEDICVFICSNILNALLRGCLHVYPFGKQDSKSKKIVYFEQVYIAYGTAPVYYQKVSFTPQSMLNLVKNYQPQSAIED